MKHLPPPRNDLTTAERAVLATVAAMLTVRALVWVYFGK